MATSYKKLWHILVDRELKKKDLQENSNLNDTWAQMTYEENSINCFSS